MCSGTPAALTCISTDFSLISISTPTDGISMHEPRNVRHCTVESVAIVSDLVAHHAMSHVCHFSAVAHGVSFRSASHAAIRVCRLARSNVRPTIRLMVTGQRLIEQSFIGPSGDSAWSGGVIIDSGETPRAADGASLCLSGADRTVGPWQVTA